MDCGFGGCCWWYGRDQRPSDTPDGRAACPCRRGYCPLAAAIPYLLLPPPPCRWFCLAAPPACSTLRFLRPRCVVAVGCAACLPYHHLLVGSCCLPPLWWWLDGCLPLVGGWLPYFACALPAPNCLRACRRVLCRHPRPYSPAAARVWDLPAALLPACLPQLCWCRWFCRWDTFDGQPCCPCCCLCLKKVRSLIALPRTGCRPAYPAPLLPAPADVTLPRALPPCLPAVLLPV